MEGFGSYYSDTLKNIDAACDAVTVALVALISCYVVLAMMIGWHVRRGLRLRKSRGNR
jgi:hypothetical protein